MIQCSETSSFFLLLVNDFQFWNLLLCFWKSDFSFFLSWNVDVDNDVIIWNCVLKPLLVIDSFWNSFIDVFRWWWCISETLFFFIKPWWWFELSLLVWIVYDDMFLKLCVGLWILLKLSLVLHILGSWNC